MSQKNMPQGFRGQQRWFSFLAIFFAIVWALFLYNATISLSYRPFDDSYVFGYGFSAIAFLFCLLFAYMSYYLSMYIQRGELSHIKKFFFLQKLFWWLLPAAILLSISFGFIIAVFSFY